MIAEQVNDLHRLLIVPLAAIYNKKPGLEFRKDDLETGFSELVPAGLKLIVRLFEQNQRDTNNSGFLVGSELSYADVKLVNLYDWFGTRREEILDKVPSLKAHAERVRNSPQLKEYYEKSDKVAVTIYF
jgi:glutathione S-transferase